MRLLVCGSRTWSDAMHLCTVLDGVLGGGPPIEVLIHGDAAGADEMAGRWAQAHDIPVEVYLPDWEQHGRSAGPIRNREMLVTGKPTMVMAFVDKPLAQSKGTANMIGQADKAGVPTVVVYAKGVLE